MIIDCYTHIVPPGSPPARPVCGEPATRTAGPSEHRQQAACVDKSLVLGWRGPSDPISANDIVAQYVASSGGKAIGIAAVNPVRDSLSQINDLMNRTEFRGLALCPCRQDFHPADSQALKVYELAERRGAAVFFDDSNAMGCPGRLGYSRPVLLDEIALDFPRLTIVISAMGFPWVDEAIALITRRQRVFADLSAMLRRPWLAYNALVTAHQFQAMDKILFGSDFPNFTAAEAIEGLYRLHEITRGSNLPAVPREALRAIVERDALAALGIARPGDVPAGQVRPEDHGQTNSATP